MSYLSLLFAPTASGMSPAAREIPNFKPELSTSSHLGFEVSDLEFPAVREEGEAALPSGVASMEHWLDLNA